MMIITSKHDEWWRRDECDKDDNDDDGQDDGDGDGDDECDNDHKRQRSYHQRMMIISNDDGDDE